MLGVAIGSFLLLLVVVYLVARPFLAPAAESETSAQLLEDGARVSAQLRELDMEFATGKIGEEEYRPLRARRSGQLAALHERLATLDGRAEPSDPAQAVSERDLERRLERAIAERTQLFRERTCPDCGAMRAPSDRFCRSCGRELAKAATGRGT